MELFSDEIRNVKDLLKEWSAHPEIEVEATFGERGKVDMQTFLRVITRLKGKGLECISQQDRLTISVIPDQVRFTLVGTGAITQYCRDNTILGKPFTAIIKDKNITIKQKVNDTIDFKDYDVRVKGRREVELKENDMRVKELIKPEVWGTKKKYFRIIRRWTFQLPGLKFDVSMTRSTHFNKDGERWQIKFQDQPLLSYSPDYEIEVEIDRSTLQDRDPFKTLINGIGDVLRGIQGSSILIRKTVKESVLKEYNNLTGTTRFRGVAPITLKVENMLKEKVPNEPNIRDNYNVTDKADGLRVHGFTNEEGELFMIDMAMNVYKTGLANKLCNNSLLDGEYITQKRDKTSTETLLFFDIYYEDEENVTKNHFRNESEDCRYNLMKKWIARWNNADHLEQVTKSTKFIVGIKTFYFEDGTKSIFDHAKTILKLDSLREYNTDGLIFTPNNLPLPDKPGARFDEQFKWKPTEDNTIDFLVTTVKDDDYPDKDKISVEIDPETNATVRYKTLLLYVGSSEDIAYNDPRATILYDLPLPGAYIGKEGEKMVRGREKDRYKAVPFIPKEYPEQLSYMCKLELHTDPKTNEEYILTERTEEPIRDMSIVEMRYDTTKAAGSRWIPIRIRTDKTERLLKGVKLDKITDESKKLLKLHLDKTLNSYSTAENVWESIHNPVTTFMITTGSETPSEKEREKEKDEGIKEVVYKEKMEYSKSVKNVKALLDFHRSYIKEKLLYGTIKKLNPNPKLLDLAVGQANDLHNWLHMNVKFVFGIDYSDDSILNPLTGAYRRLLNQIVKAHIKQYAIPVPHMYFTIGDSSKRLIDGSAGKNDEERDIMRSVFGRIEPIGAVPPDVKKYGEKELENGADCVICMYAIHYFFETEDKFNGFLQNIADNLMIGGHFVGTNFDGEAVFDLLRYTDKGRSVQGKTKDNKIIWEITKEYEAEDLPADNSAFGMAIDVNFATIGIPHREYLVPWKLLVAKLKTIGCELVFTEMYEKSHKTAVDEAKKEGEKYKYSMSADEKKYSFLNRSYIFKRTSRGLGEIGKVAESDIEIVEENGEDIEDEFVSESEANEIQTAIQFDKTKAVTLKPQIKDTKGVTSFISSMKERKIVQPQAQVPTQEQAQAQQLTVPVKPATLAQRIYKPGEVVQFYENSIQIIKNLELPDKYKSYAARYLAPNAPFRIRDVSDPTDLNEYPSITHFMAAMKFKYASANEESVKNIAKVFNREGEIHQSWLAARITEQKSQKGKMLSEAKHYELLKKETNDVQTKEESYIKQKSVNFDNTKWSSIKDKLLKEAILQRLKADKKFCAIVQAAISQKKYLLYKNDATELGGTLEMSGRIKGANKYGEFILSLAAEYPTELRACLSLPDL
jgi:hypothetical protein